MAGGWRDPHADGEDHGWLEPRAQADVPAAIEGGRPGLSLLPGAGPRRVRTDTRGRRTPAHIDPRVDDRALADFFEAAVRAAGGDAKTVANWVTGEFLRYLKNDGGSVAGAKITPAQLGALVALVKKGEVSGSAAKDVFAEMWRTGAAPEAIVTAKGLTQVSDETAITAAVDAVLAENPKPVADYKAGNQRALAALVGPVMKRMGGKANPAIINRVLAERISHT